MYVSMNNHLLGVKKPMPRQLGVHVHVIVVQYTVASSAWTERMASTSKNLDKLASYFEGLVQYCTENSQRLAYILSSEYDNRHTWHIILYKNNLFSNYKVSVFTSVNITCMSPLSFPNGRLPRNSAQDKWLKNEIIKLHLTILHTHRGI